MVFFLPLCLRALVPSCLSAKAVCREAVNGYPSIFPLPSMMVT